MQRLWQKQKASKGIRDSRYDLRSKLLVLLAVPPSSPQGGMAQQHFQVGASGIRLTTSFVRKTEH